MNIHFGPWDVALILVVSVQGTLLSFVHNPKWKALVLSIPVPFTLANLSLNTPVGPAHVLGMVLLLLFLHAVRWMHVGARLPIVLAIAVAAIAYCILGTSMARAIPDTPALFWAGAVAVYLLGAALFRWLPRRDEPGQRSPLPVPVKFAAIAFVVSLLVLLKNQLQGYMTMFPMVTTIAAYEARRSLWTMARQIPVIMLTMVPMVATMRLAQTRLSVPGSLLVGWAVFALALWPFLPGILSAAQRAETERHVLCQDEEG